MTRAHEAQLREASSGKPEFQRIVTVGADGKFDETLPLNENDVILLTLEPACE
ncbi:MAG TPA: hypothetical protein VKA67_13880 [Verrucomicrobiae bacterium]|nr:hypothetical protein [Verrucomicrobiae bacterium]